MSLATADFLQAWRQATRQPVGLCKIELTAPSAVTLYLATAGVVTPDGVTWEEGFRCSPIRDEVGYLDSGPAPVTVEFTLYNRAFAGLYPDSLLDALSAYQFKRAAVTLYLWERSLTDFADALQVFKGYIDAVEPTVGEATFTAIQDRAWNVTVPSKVVDKTSYPNASDSAQGMAVPIIYGKHEAPDLRSPLSGLGFEDDFHNAGGARGVVPLIVADTGAGADKVKLLAASHALSDLYGSADTTGIFVAGADRWLVPVDTTSGFTESLGASESYATIDDDLLSVRVPIVPVDVRTGAGNNSALNPRRALDISDETNYATLNQSSSYNKLELYLPSPGTFGKIMSVTIVACVSGNAGNGNNFRIYGRDNVGSASSTVTASSTSATATIISGAYDTNWWNQRWAFGVNDGALGYGGVSGNTISLCVDFSGGTTNVGRVYWVVLYATVKPTRNLVVPGTRLQTFGGLMAEHGHSGFARRLTPNQHNVIVSEYSPDVYTLDGSYFANLHGYADDGSGTYSGTAGAVLQRPCDILRHFLVTHAGVSGGNIVTGAGEHGSFVDARTALRNAQPNDFIMAAWIGQKSNVQQMAQKLCAQSLSTFWLDRFDNKWRFGVWKKGDPITYDMALSWYQVGSYFKTEEGSIVDLRNEFRVQWLYDYFKGKSLAESFVGPSGSSQGWSQPTTRDQLLTVTAGVNDDLDWRTGAWDAGGTTFAEVLTAGTYEPIDLAQEIQGKLRARVVAYYSYVGHGFTIKAAYNDALEFGYGASTYETVLLPGRYTADGIAIAVEQAMNAAIGSDVISCTYSQSTNKFTITSSGSNVNIVGPTTATDPAVLAFPVLGWVAGTASASSLTAPRETYYDRFWVRNESTFTFAFLWSTGASASTSCASLVGYDATDTSTANYQFATYSRGDRESLSVSRQTAYGVADAHTVVADWIRDENSAVSLRDRLWDMASQPPLRLLFDTYAMPDLQRFQVFEVSSDVDGHAPFARYGSDGSWAYKALRCIGTTQHMGPTFHTEVVAVEA